MRAIVVEGIDDVRLAARPEPAAGTAAIVAPERAGLCGTDLKILSGAIPVAMPLVLGHEVVGRVVAPGARGLVEAGTRVVVNPGAFCGWCPDCRSERPNLCARGGLLGREADGLFADLVAVDELLLHPVPDHVPPAEAVVLQVLGTCVHAQSLVRAEPDTVAVVLGLGTTGLLHTQLLRARGVGTVVGVTRSEAKRSLAARFGAVAVAPDDAEDVVDDLTGGRGAGLVVESVGSVATLAKAVRLAGPAAQVLAYGIVTGSGDLPFYELYFKEIDLVSARGARPQDYDRAVALVAAGRLELGPLVSATFPFDEVGAALEALRLDPALLKVILEVS